MSVSSKVIVRTKTHTHTTDCSTCTTGLNRIGYVQDLLFADRYKCAKNDCAVNYTTKEQHH